MSSIEFFYDYGSPYSHLADSRLPPFKDRTGVEVLYRPMLLGGVFKATGNRSPFADPVEAGRAYFSRELRREVEYVGVEFVSNPHFPSDTLGRMRMAQAARAEGVFELFHAPTFFVDGEMFFGDDRLDRVETRLQDGDVEMKCMRDEWSNRGMA